MPRPRKPPAFLVEATVYRSGKLADLPSDTARLGFFYAVLGQAKLAERPGMFASKGHFREVAGRFGSHLKDYVRVGILEVAPALCDRCKPRWEGIRVGAMVVHDWHEHQYDPRKLERGRLWDMANRQPVSDVVSDDQSDDISDAQSDVVSDGDLARDRAPDRAPAPGSNVERRTENGISSQEEDRSSPLPGAAERPDVAALLALGWRRVAPKQLALLDEIADRHDRLSKGEAWGTWAAAVIASTEDGVDPLARVKAMDARWQAGRRAEIDAEEARAAAERARHAQEATAALRSAPVVDEAAEDAEFAALDGVL